MYRYVRMNILFVLYMSVLMGFTVCTIVFEFRRMSRWVM